jgi:hypothetical protein
MKTLMKTATVAAILSAVSLSTAQAAVMTFSGLTANLVTQANYVEDGITASTTSGAFWGFPSGGELHFDPSGFTNSTYDFTMASPFSLISFDVSCCSDAGAVANLTAFNASNAVINTLSVSAASNGTQTFTGWTGISRLRIVNTVAHFGIDNLTLTPTAVSSAVPEPATWATMLSGFGLMGFGMRRRNQAVSVRYA